MDIKRIQDECWDALPSLRKRLAGRQRVDDIVATAIANWDAQALRSAGVDRYASELLAKVDRYGEARYGFIWMFLLQAVAAAVIQWLIKRWLDKRIEGMQE